MQHELLNPEQIAARRIPLEDAEISLGKNANWYCGYCKRKMINEATFMRHHCDAKIKAQDFATPTGQAAFGYFNTWMRLRRFTPQNGATFQESKFFKSFIKFAQMVIDTNIAKPEKYIELMIAGEVQPPLWCRQSAYKIYLDTVDKLVDPLEDAQDTIVYLMQLAEKEELLTTAGEPDLTRIAIHLGSQQILSLVRQRRLSPWILFCAPSFKPILASLDASQRNILNEMVNGEYMAEKFKQNKSTVEKIKQLALEVGL